MTESKDFILLTGRANPVFAHTIGEILGVPIDEPVSVFADSEIRIRIQPNLRRKHIFIIQPTSTPANDHLMELLFMIDAAKRSSAAEITAVIPYFGYSRQDRKELPRVPISSSLVASLITSAGADRILTVDIHSDQQEGFIQKPWDNLYASYSLIPAIMKRKIKDLVVAAPDKGGVLQATAYAKLLDVKEIAIVYKQRDIKLNDISNTLAMIGEVKDKNVLIVDDIISTAGTIVNAANYIHKNGAKSVRVIATHGVFSDDAIEKINNSAIDEVLVTDSIAHREQVRNNPKITIISIAPLVAEAIRRIRTGESISKDLIL